MKGMDEPTRLYTCDIFVENLALEPEKPPLKRRNIRANRVKQRLTRNNFKENLFLGNVSAALIFEQEELQECRNMFSQAFYDTFNEGFEYYIDGDWKKARKMLRHVESLKHMEDGPTRLILEIMK